jgi:acyl-CoA synthetase (AMP-forming)/AMP-acid ligase II
MVQSKKLQTVSLSAIKNNSRPLSTVVCYEGIYSDAVYKTWGDFLDGTARLRRHIETTAGERWLLYCEDCWDFLLAFMVLLQCKKEILLCPIISPGFIANIRGAPPTKPVAPLLTDQVFSQEETPENTCHIPTLLQEAVPQTMEEAPQINADETSIILLTSGSTGKPKMVRHRLTEFEYDNRIMLSTWGEEFLKRKFCSTVSQQHVYGLLAAVLGPFHGGVPFRKKIIEFPEELEKFSDTEYVIVTVPAFLKRTVEIEKAGDLKLKSPWIMASGGFLSPEIAKKTSEVFGFWPVE